MAGTDCTYIKDPHSTSLCHRSLTESQQTHTITWVYQRVSQQPHVIVWLHKGVSHQIYATAWLDKSIFQQTHNTVWLHRSIPANPHYLLFGSTKWECKIQNILFMFLGQVISMNCFPKHKKTKKPKIKFLQRR